MSFDAAHRFVAQWEGGLTDHPSDPGGITNYGVSLRFLKTQGLDVGDIDNDGDIDADDIRKLTPEDAKRIFKREFWAASKLDILDFTHPLCAFVVYDTSVNMGAGWGKRFLQQAIGGLDVDGIWGPKTWAAIATAPDREVALRMIELRRDRYYYLVERNFSLKCFLKGWLNRINALKQAISH